MYKIIIQAIAYPLIIASQFLYTTIAIANPTLDDTASNAQVATQLEGPGITISNFSVVIGTAEQFGIFNGGASSVTPGPQIGIEEGVFMTTSRANASGVSDQEGGAGSTYNAARGANDAGGISDNLGLNYSDPQLTSIDSGATYDPIILQMQAVPVGNYLKISFVFASDEYPEFVCTVFNDAFGMFIKDASLPDTAANWQNIGTLPGTTTPIAVNSINGGTCGSYESSFPAPADLGNSRYYVDNGDGNTPANNTNLQYDGFTIPFTVETAVTANTTYDVKIALADAGDALWDGALFLKWLSSSDYSADADLELDLTASQASLNSGDTVVFTINVTNTGQDAASGIQAAFTLPDGFSYSSDTSGGNYNPSTGVWTIPGSLAASGGSTSVQITATAGGYGSVNAFAEISTVNAYDVDSTPANGTQSPVEDDEDTIMLTLPDATFDYGDAPADYGSPGHIITSGIHLGTGQPDEESGALHSADANNDDNDNTDDENGVTIPTLSQGDATIITVTTNGSGGYLQGWIDWNGDGDFADTGEQIATDLQDSDNNGTINVPILVPADASTSQTFARFRWSTTSGLDSTAAAPDGEVEDYALTITLPQTDLELGLLLQPDSNAITGVPFSTIMTLSNTSDLDATNVQVNWPVPAGLTLIELYNAEQNTDTGDFEPTTAANYNTGNGLLTVGNIDSHTTTHYIARYIRTTSGSSDIQAEVSDADQPDSDSTPASGFTDDQDDVATVSITASNTVTSDICQTFDVTTGGAASVNGLGEYIVTPDAGNSPGFLWSNRKIDLAQDFDIELSVYLGTKDSNGADGMTFVLQTDPRGANAQGTNGGFMGVGSMQYYPEYGGTSADPAPVAKSLTIEFDTWNNGAILGDTTTLDHTAVYLDGDMGYKTASNELLGATVVGTGGNIEDGTYHATRYLWDATTQTLQYYFDGVLIGTVNKDLVTHLGSQYATIGFTGSTGGFSNLQKGCFTKRPILLDVIEYDYSDAPTRITTTDGSTITAYGDATHKVVDSIRLGSSVDADETSLAGTEADGDGSDDDGVRLHGVTLQDQTLNANTPVTLTVTATGTGRLYGWIDWDRDGTFGNNANELIISETADNSGTRSVSVTPPNDLTPGTSYARFRYTTDTSANAAGAGGNGEVEDYLVGLLSGFAVSGRVFNDANTDGQNDDNETGISQLSIVLYDTVNNTCISTRTNANGKYAFNKVLPGNYQVYEASRESVPTPTNCGTGLAKDPGGYLSTTDNVSTAFTVSNASVSGINFGDVKPPLFELDNSQTILPNTSAIHPHTFTAQTNGSVSFSITAETADPGSINWNSQLLLDVNCDSQLDGGGITLPASISVSAGDQICIINKVLAPADVTTGAQHTLTVQSDFTYGDGTTGLANNLQTRQDVTRSVKGTTTEPAVDPVTDPVGTPDIVGGEGKLSLVKSVWNVTRNIDGKAVLPGETLRYTIHYENIGNGPLNELIINDSVPEFTELVPGSLLCTDTPAELPACAANDDLSDGLSWTWTDSDKLLPGSSGSVSYEVVIE